MSPGAQTLQPVVWTIDIHARSCRYEIVNIPDTAVRCRRVRTQPSVQIESGSKLRDSQRQTNNEDSHNPWMSSGNDRIPRWQPPA